MLFSSNSFNPASFLMKPTATQYGTENFAEYGVEGFFFSLEGSHNRCTVPSPTFAFIDLIFLKSLFCLLI
jgi:hypothetical protein